MSEDRQSHDDRVTKLLGTSSSSDITASTTTGGKVEEGMEEGAAFTGLASAPGARNHAAPDRKCSHVKPDGTRCKGWEDWPLCWPFRCWTGGQPCGGGQSPIPGRRGAPPAGAGRAWASLGWASFRQWGGLRLTGDNPLPEPHGRVPEAFEEDPEALKSYIRRRVQNGQEIPRGLILALETLYSAEESVHVDEPHSFDELAKLSREERRQLLRQLEAERRADPFRAEAWRARQRNAPAAEQ
jgi:hypothetical protein